MQAEYARDTGMKPTDLIEIEIAGTPIRIGSHYIGDEPLTWNGKNWFGLGWVLERPVISQGITGEAQRVPLRLSGMPHIVPGHDMSLAQAFIQQRWRALPFRLWDGAIAEANGVVGIVPDPVLLFSGLVGATSITDDGQTCVLEIEGLSWLSDDDRASRFQACAARSAERGYVNETLWDEAAATVDQKVRWPNAGYWREKL